MHAPTVSPPLYQHPSAYRVFTLFYSLIDCLCNLPYQHAARSCVLTLFYTPTHSADAKAPARRAPPPPAGAKPLRPPAAPTARAPPPKPATKPTKRPAPLAAAKPPVVPPKPAPRQRPPQRGVNDVIPTLRNAQDKEVIPTLRNAQDKSYNSIVCAEAPSSDYAVAAPRDVIYGDNRDSLTEEGGRRPLSMYSDPDHRKSIEYEYPEVRRGKVNCGNRVILKDSERNNANLVYRWRANAIPPTNGEDLHLVSHGL